MGSGIRGRPVLLRRGSLQNQVHEIHERKGMIVDKHVKKQMNILMVCTSDLEPGSSGGKNHPGTKELNKLPPCVKLPSNRLGKNPSLITEKAPVQATDREAIAQCQGKKQFHDRQQQNSITGLFTSSRRVPRLRREPLIREHHEAEQNKIPSAFKDVSQNASSRAEAGVIQSVCCKQKGAIERCSGQEREGAGPSRLAYRDAAATAMFLDFESAQMMKEDSDEDNASDLSDSERIPIPPSPCTPPELNLRAEEIDPICFEHLFDAKRMPSVSCYPDFLPPPFNNWDLKALSVFINTECKSEPRPEPVGLLEKYMDRLLEMEWLQMQTVQAEKGKAAKTRPQTAPGGLRSLKSPGKSKVLRSALPNRQLALHGNLPRLLTPSLRRDCPGEGTIQVGLQEGQLKAAVASHASSAHGRRSAEGRNEGKKWPAIKQDLVNMHSFDATGTSMMQGVGNMRPPKQSSSFHGSTVPLKGLPVHAGTDLKNGHAPDYTSSKKASGNTKLKANGLKQTECKFK